MTLSRKTPLRRRKRVPAVNRERRARLHERNYGDRGEAVRKMLCTIAGRWLMRGRPCRGRIHAAHVVARGMGGHNGDRRQLIPLCADHHGEQGSIGVKSFAALYEVDLHAEAARIAVELDERGLP
jgi:hypothetical protein